MKGKFEIIGTEILDVKKCPTCGAPATKENENIIELNLITGKVYCSECPLK